MKECQIDEYEFIVHCAFGICPFAETINIGRERQDIMSFISPLMLKSRVTFFVILW